MTPTVTVLTAVFNGERWLDETIASVLAQRFTEFEFLIVDDGSTDSTPERLEAWQRKDARIRVARQPRRGQTAALIAGVSASRGRYLARQDVGDVSLPERLERQVRHLEAHPAAGVLGCATDIIDQEGRPAGRMPMRHGAARVRRGLLSLKVTMVHTSIMMRRELYDACGGYREAFELSQDIDLWLRAVQRSDVDNLAEPLVRWRLNDAGVYGSRREQQLKYGGIALAFARERQRFGADSYALLQRVNGNLDTFASEYRLRGLLYGMWGELLFRGLQDASAGRRYLGLALSHGRVSPGTMGLYAWSLLGRWPGGAPMAAREARS